MRYYILFLTIIILWFMLRESSAEPRILSADDKGFIVNSELVQEWDLLVEARGQKVGRRKGDRKGIKNNNYGTYTMTLAAMETFLELRAK